MKPTFFPTQAAFRQWLQKHHQTESELIVGFHKRSSGRPSMTWAEAVEEVLCFGWIDGVRRGLDADSYTNRFTPRKPGSSWSAVNIAKAKELIESGRMTPAGARALEAANERAAKNSYEQRHTSSLSKAQEREFRQSPKAWDWFQAQPPSYRRAAAYWVVSAKKDQTKRRRLAKLIEDSAAGRRIPPLA